jgi:hypothetical protein
MYSHVATGTVAGGVAGVAVAVGFAPMHIAAVVGASAASMGALVGLLRFAHGTTHIHRHR